MKKPFYKRIWFIVLMVLIVLGAIGSLFGEEEKQPQNQGSQQQGVSVDSGDVSEPIKPELPDMIEVDAISLIEAYNDNEVSADNTYKGEIVKITAEIVDIGKDVMDNVYIKFDDGQTYALDSVQCYFKDKDEIEKVSELSKGDEITIYGKCEGKTLFTISIKNCYIL